MKNKLNLILTASYQDWIAAFSFSSSRVSLPQTSEVKNNRASVELTKPQTPDDLSQLFHLEVEQPEELGFQH